MLVWPAAPTIPCLIFSRICPAPLINNKQTVGHYPTLPPMQHSFPCLQEWISRIEPAKYLLDTSNGTRHPKDDVFGTGYREIHDLLEALRQEPLMEEAEDGVVNSFPAEPCYGDAAINELITSPVEEQDPCTFPAVEGEQLPDQELSGLYAQAGLNFTHGHEVYNNARARMALSEDDANTTPPPLQTFGL